MSSGKGITLAMLTADAVESGSWKISEIHPKAVKQVSTKVHVAFLDWCEAQPGWKGRSKLSHEQQRKVRNRASAKQHRDKERERIRALEAETLWLATENVRLQHEVDQLRAIAEQHKVVVPTEPLDPMFDTDMAGLPIYDTTGGVITFLPPDVHVQ